MSPGEWVGIATVVAALAGMYRALTHEFRTELRREIGGVRDDLRRVDARIDDLDSRLTARIEALDSRLTARIETLDHRVFDLAAGLRPHIEAAQSGTGPVA